MRALPKSLLTAMLLVLAMLLRAPAQQSPAAVPPGASELYELVSDTPGNPVIRMRVSHDHGWSHTLKCHGYLYVSRESIRYEVVRSAQPHTFDFAPAQLRSLKEWWPEESPVSAELRFTKGPNYHFALLTQKQFEAAVERGSVQVQGTSILGIPMLPGRYIVRAIAKFDTVVEELRAAQRASSTLPAGASAPAVVPAASLAAAPAGAPTAGGSPRREVASAITPVFKLLDPAGAESSKPLTSRGESLRLRGLVSHPAGVTALSLNGNSLPFETINPQTVAFDAPAQPLQPGRNEFLLLAKGQDQGEARFSLVVLRPGIRLLEPAQSETAEAAVTLRGVVLGLPQVGRAEIAGRPASLQPLADGSVQFEAQAVTLAVGRNALEAVFTGAQGEREVFTLAVVRTAPAAPAASTGPAALSVREVEDALRSGIPMQRVAAMVTLYGVDFALTADIEQRLRAAGADDALLLAISKAKK